MWFLAPPGLERLMLAVGNNASAPVSACEWLARPPHPAVRTIFQPAGSILFFGQGVPHATCALEEAWGVGVQLGYYPTPTADLTRDPARSFNLSAAHCLWI